MFLNRPSALAMKLFVAPDWPSWATTKQQWFMLSFASCFRSFAVSKKGFSLIRRRREESSTGLWKAFLCTRLLDFTCKAQHSFVKICFQVNSTRRKFSLLLLLLFA